MPNLANPQNWNRYSYVSNNPLRYTDPTGHMLEASGGGAGSSCADKKCRDDVQQRKANRHKDKENEKSPVINPIESYCGNSSGLACLANATQDIATGIDLVGLGLIETPAVAVGCVEGGPLGCAVAEVGVIATWNTTLNNAEFAASSASLVFTVLDDVINNGGWGENSSTSLTTWVAGLAPLTPSWDLAVDTYASGYNHGFFNGVNTILDNGLFK